MKLRLGVPEDLVAMQDLYVQTIKWVCNQDYDAEQLAVWASSVKNHERWQKVVSQQLVIVAERNNQMVGYGTLREDNYIDFLYIHKDFQRRGIAQKILDQIEMHAKNKGNRHLTSEVSITAKPFFEKNGYSVLARQHNQRQGVELINFRMEKVLQ